MYADNGSLPLVTINFDSAWITPTNFGAADFIADNVTIICPAANAVLHTESFSFSFANQVPLGGNPNNGFTATAAFTSSAIPEPATMFLLAAGAICSLRRRK